MTHATITPHTPTLCAVEFAYHAATKDAVKALPGSTFDGSVWYVAILHLPTLKGMFDTLEVEPAVVVAYHELLKRMMNDLAGCEHSKTAQELIATHERGIAAIIATGWQPTPTQRPRHSAPQPVAGPVEAKDADLAQWLTGVKNAKKAADRKSAIVKNKRKKVTA